MSPDGRWIVALSIHLQKLLLFDMQTQAWRELAQAGSIEWQPGPATAVTIYFERTGPGPEIVRIAVKGGTPEVILSLKDIHTAGDGPGMVLAHSAGRHPVSARHWRRHGNLRAVVGGSLVVFSF
jgi:hypothetical protein